MENYEVCLLLSVHLTLLCICLASTYVDASPKSDSLIKSLLHFDEDEKFIWYVPHGGFGNQMICLRNGLRLASILNRTLIIPPLFGHGESEIPVCKVKQDQLRWDYWRFKLDRLYKPNYVSIADIVDISKLSEDLVRTVDLRIFVATRCGIDVTKSFTFCGWCKPLVKFISKLISKGPFSSLSEKERHARCGVEIGAYDPSMAHGYQPKYSSYKEHLTCFSHAFVYFRGSNGTLLSMERTKDFLGGNCPEGRTSHHDYDLIKSGKYYNNLYKRPPLQFINALERYSKHSHVDFLSMGSTFFYFDLEMPTGDPRADLTSCGTEYMRFNPAIMNIAMEYAASEFHEAFMCVHFRGGDGYFSEKRLQNLQDQAKEFKLLSEKVANRSGPQSIEVFLMSDITSSDWKVKFEEVFEAKAVHFSSQIRSLEEKARVEAYSMGYGVFTNRFKPSEIELLRKRSHDEGVEGQILGDSRHSVQPYLEQVVCSCAELGFSGRMQSTFTVNIYRLRLGKVCSAAQS